MGGFGDRFGRKTRLPQRPRRLHASSRSPAASRPTSNWLIVFRVGQGIGGAAMAPISLAILLRRLPAAAARRGRRALGCPRHGRRRRRPVARRRAHRVRRAGTGSSSSTCPSGVVALALCWWIMPQGRRPSRSGSGIDLPAVAGLGRRALLPGAGADPGERLGLELGAHRRALRRGRRVVPAVRLAGAAHAPRRCSTSACCASARSRPPTRR